MKDNKFYYKVVTHNLKSLFAHDKAEVQYKMNEFVTAPEWLRMKGYHLLVFKNLRCAWEYFITNYIYKCCWKIFKCKIQNKVKMPDALSCNLASDGLLEKDTLCPIVWPIGTIMVEKVMLLEEIKKYE